MSHSSGPMTLGAQHALMLSVRLIRALSLGSRVLEGTLAAPIHQLLKSLIGQNTARKNLTMDHIPSQEPPWLMDHRDLPPLGES